MTRRCKCEHWQDCPTCAPQRFDADGKRKPPEPTPLQACRAELETMREALALHEVGSAYAHRLAVMLECALLDPTGTWNEAHALLDEYRAACRAAAPMQEPPTFMGEPVVMPNATLEQQMMDACAPKNEREWWAFAEIGRLRAEVEVLRADSERLTGERDVAIGMLAYWCVAVDQNGTGWDDWDEHYKDAMYRPCPIRELLDKEINAVRSAQGERT